MPRPDYTNSYNTKLNATDEAKFLNWAKTNNRLNDLFDYDMRGAWLAGAGQSDEGHFTDQFKKPNHPTFSVESQYSHPYAMPGGVWSKDVAGRLTFTPSVTNLMNMTPNDLRQYFYQVEPNVILKLPKTR